MKKTLETIGKLGNVLTFAGAALCAIKWTGKAIMEIIQQD